MKTEIPPGPTARPHSRKRAPLARPQFEALESRLLMAADLPIVALPPPSVELSQATAGVHMLAPREIVVLDASLQNLADLRDALAQDTPQAEVLVLDASRDAFDQIGEKLAAGEPVSAIHLVAHGQAGQFVIRGAVIDASELARRTAQLQAWNFADDADILLYGCNVAEGPNGQAFVDMLASLTGADVAASSDLTGAIDLGADWDLEVSTGSIETATIAGPRLAKLWRGTLDATAAVAATTGSPVSGVATPLAFERNAGQTDGAVEFLARGSGYSVFLDDGDAVIDVRHEDGSGNVVRLSLAGASTPQAALGESLLDTKSHYLIGDATSWRTDIANYGAVRYDGVYDGIDIRYYGTDRQLEYDFLVDAGVSADAIALDIDGAQSLTIGDNGDLVLALEGTGATMRFKAPVSYQLTADGRREAVTSAYTLRADGTVGFTLGEYDRSRALVIDPVLGYGTYLGGTGLEVIESVATDSSGNVYVTGRTGSAAFPTSVGAYDTALGGSTDAFVTKFNASGTLQYSTFFGGSSNEWAYNIAVDASGQAYVVGETSSSDFAIVSGADSSFSGSSDGYLVKLNAAGTSLLYSTFYGSTNADAMSAVVVGSGSTVYVAGSSFSSTWDGFAASYNTALTGASSLAWSYAYAAAGTEKLYDIDIDSTGDIYLIGEVSTSGLSFGGPYDSTQNGGADVFLVRMSGSGGVEYVTYYGGSGNDYGNGIVVADDNTVYITGTTYSTSGIASAGAYDTTGDGTNGNAFLAHFNTSLSGSAQLLFGTYFGTSGATYGLEIALDTEGRPVIVGQTSGVIPVSALAHDGTLTGASDGYVAVFSPNGTTLAYGAYVGGNATDATNAVAVDSSGRTYVVGTTTSTDAAPASAYDGTGDATNGDGFIAQFLPLESRATATNGGGLSINGDGGNDAYLKADNGGAILGGRTAFTLEFTFSIGTNAATDNPLLSYSVASQDDEVSVNLKPSGRLQLGIENTFVTTTGTWSQLLDGNVHSVSVTWDRATGNGAFYVDGTLAESFSGLAAGATIDSGGSLIFGQEQDSVEGGFNTAQVFSGTLYDIRIFSDVRTATEIRAGHLADLPRYESGLLADWRFDDWHIDGTTTEAVGGNDLTLGHAADTGSVASSPSLTLSLAENAATGTVVGAITAISEDREARIDALLAADSTLIYSAQTNKFYKLDPNWISWSAGLALATSTTLNGVAGQMVTIHSATENDIVRTINGGMVGWLGASDAATEGTWRWMDGGSPGAVFWQGTSSGYRVDSAYTNFQTNQPDDYGNVAVADQLYIDASGQWDDADAAGVSRTLIEWDADEVLDASAPITYSITSQTVAGAFAIDSDTGTLTVADGSLLEYEAATSHTLSVRVTDGSNTYDKTYTVTLANVSVEVANTVPGAQSPTEDTAFVFSSGGGNAITVSDGTGTDTRLQVSLSVSQGTLTLSQTTGLSVVSGANGSGAMVIDGTESAINAALNGMTYLSAAEYSGADSLQITTSLSADLSARYTFDAGTVADDAAGTAQNGSFVGNATTTTDSTRGTVLSLDGAGDSAQVASVFGSPTNVTIGGWVNVYNAATRGEMISLNDRVHIALDEPGLGVKGSIQTGAASWNDLESGRFIAGDGWHHVMFVVDDTNNVNTLYIDGITVASESNASSIYWTGATTTYFGQHPGGSAYLHGLLDDLRVYSRALSAAEVASVAAERTTSDADTVALTVAAANDAPEDLYFIPGVAESSLTGVYTFSNTASLGQDDAGADAPMTLYGTPAQTTGPSGSGALDLAGGVSGQYGDLAGITTGGAMTIAGQVRFDSTGDWQRIVDFGQANSTGITAIYVGRIWTTNDLTFTLEKDLGGGFYDTYRATAANAIVNGTWLHFAATVDGSGAMALYVNGVLADTETGIVPEVGVRTNNFVGKSNWGGDAAFDGAIDNLVVASGAMTATQVAALYQQSNAVTIDENATTGTIVGTVVVADRDAGDTHTFSLTNSATGRFTIAADGTVTVSNGSLLDYESATSHGITARATDTGLLTRDEGFTITLANLNEAPSFVALNGTPTHTEGGSAVILDADAQITDPELSNLDDFSGATLTLVRNGGADTDDALAFDGTNVTVSGANVLVGGTQIGTYVFSGGEMVVSFGANSTQARVNTMLRNIVYWNWSEAPPASVQINWTIDDGNAGAQGSGAALSTAGSTTVTITAVADVPVISAMDGDVRAYTEGSAPVLIGSANSVTDADSADFDGGTLTVSFTSGSDSAEDVLGIRNEGTGAGQIGVSGGDVTYGGVVIGTWTGGSAGANLVVTLNASANPTSTLALLNNLTYENTDTAHPTTTTRAIRVVLTDGDGGTSANVATTMTVAAVNDSPAFSGLDGTPSHTENGAAVVLDANVTVSDAELSAANNFSGATLTLVRNGGTSSEDVFSATGTLSSISAASGSVVVGGTTVGTYTNSSGTLVFTFDASATNALVNSAMQQIAYANSSDAPPASVQIAWTFDDGNGGAQGSGGALGATGSTTVTISAVNDAPVLNNAANPVLTATTEDAGAPTGAVGTLVSSLVDFATPSGQIDNVTDADGGASLGIAITGADATNGTWFYSIDSGTTWSALGAVSDGNARLLAADAGTRLYFQGNANFSGTVANAITFHAWDRTSGTNGSVADLSDDAVSDLFSSVSYSNNDGTATWTSDWVETDVDGGGAGSGRIFVRPTGDLEIRARALNNTIYRQVDLSGASASTLSFDYVNTLSSGDTIVIQASGNGGASYTTLTGGTFSSSLNTGSGTYSLDISSFIATNTRIRFLVSSVGGEDRLYVDNVQVSFPSGRTGSSSAFSSAFDTASLTVSAVNDPPVAQAGGPYTLAEGATLVLNASASSDADGDTLTYAWDLDNDGNYGETGEPTTVGPSVSWATLQSFGIDDDGSYTIGLRVGDGTVTTTTTTTLTVTNAAPTIAVSGAATVAAGQTYTLTVGVTDPGNDAVTSWKVNWGDGTVSTYAGTPTSVTHTFAQGGFARGITVSVADEDGSYSPNDVLLSSYLGDRVLRLDGTSGTLEATLPTTATLDGPSALAIGPDGYLYVASLENDRIVRYDLSTNTLVGTFVTAGSGGLDVPAALSFGPDGNLYVASYGTNQILEYNGTTGAFVGAFASLDSANALAWGPDGYLYAGSWFTGEGRRFDIAGAAVDAGAFLTLGGGFGISSLLFGSDGFLYVGDANFSDLLKYNATTGALVGTIDNAIAPYGLANGPDGTLFVADFNNQAVERFRLDTGASLGSFDDGATGVDRPWGVTFNPSVLVAVTAGTPGVTVSAISGSTGEAGTTATFSIVLDSAPTAPVTIALSSGDATEGSISAASVTFTVSNWNTAQTVTVTGVDDVLADGDVTYSIVTGAAGSADSNYNGLAVADVSVTNTDNDTAGVTVSAISGNTTEAGGTATFTIVLDAAPTADVTISVATGDATEGAVSTSLLTFTSVNWNVAQTVTVTGVDDAFVDGGVTYTIVTGATSSSDSNYNGLAVADVSVTNTDNDTAGVTVSTISGNTTETGGTATFTVVLDSAPTADVTISVATGDATEGSVSTSVLTFTSTNWSVAQTVTVTGVNDNLDDGDIAFTIVTGASASVDTTYQGLAVADVAVTNLDDDATPILVIPSPVTTPEDTPVSLSGLSVSDASGDLSTLQLAVSNGSLTVSLAGGSYIAAGMNGSGSLTLTGTQGSLVAALSTLRYRPSLGVSGADSLSITATDTTGLSASGTLALSVTAVNDAPIARDDSATAVGVSGVTGNVLTNDSDAEADPLQVTQFSVAGDPSIHTAGASVTIALTGTFSLAANGNFSFTPQVGFSGTAPLVTYTVADGNGGTATGDLALRAGSSATGWGVSGSASVTEGQSASYVISLSDSIALGGSASVALGLADTTTSGSDHASFAAAVTAAIASRPDLAFDGTRLTYSPTAFGGYGRTYSATGAAGAVSIASTGTSLELRDDEFLRVDLDFAFDYFGVSQSSVIVDANGYVTFGSSAGSVFTNSSLGAGTALGGLPAIAAFWDDLDPNAGGDVYVETQGSPGSRQFVIEWSDTPYYGSGSADGATVQLVLHEGSGLVEMRYLDVDFAGVDTSRDGGASATIGLQNGSGTGDEFSFDTASVVAGSSLVYRPQGVAMSPLTITLTTTDDSIAEGTEDFSINLSAALGSGITSADTLTTLLMDNDFIAPVNVVPVSVTAVEDTVFAFTGGNTISITDGDVNVTSVSVAVISGTVSLTVASGASVSAGLLGSSAFTLSGSLAQINASLATLAYTPDANFAGSDTLVISSADASALSDTDTVTLTVSPVDDAPVLTGVTLSVSQGGSVTLAPADFTIVDPDGPAGARLVDVRNLAGGLFELVSAPGVALSTFAYADVVAGLVRFVHSGSSSPPAFEASVRDGVTPGTYVAASVGFTPTPVLIVPGPTPEQVYSIVLTNPGAPPSLPPASPTTPTSPSQPTSTGTATQQQSEEESSRAQGGRGPGEVDPRLLMTMATPRTPQVSAASAPEAGAAAVAVAAAAQTAPAAQANASTLTPMPTGTAPAPVQGDAVQAALASPERSGWEMPAPLTMDLPPATADQSQKPTEEEQQFEILVNGVRLTGVSLSVGVVTWALRAGGILSSLLASLPAWRYVDPLPVLERADRGKVVWRSEEDEESTDEDKSVEEILEDKRG